MKVRNDVFPSRTRHGDGLESGLLVRSERLAEESYLGYCLRLAHENGLSRTSWLPKPKNLSRECSQQTNQRARYCPLCLAAGQPWQEAWTWAPLPVCTAHAVGLVDRCGSCKSELTWRKARYRMCQCGFELAKAKPTHLSEVGRHLALALGGQSRSGEAWSAMAGFNRRTASRIISTLGASVVWPKGRRSLRDFRRANLSECLKIYEGAAELLSDWPHQLENWLATLQRQRLGAHPAGPSRVFREAYALAHKARGTEACPFIGKALEDYVCKHWPYELTKRNVWIPKRDEREGELIPLAQAARRLRMRPERIAEFAASHGAELKKFAGPKGRVRLFVSSADLGLVEIAARENMPYCEAAQELCLKEIRVLKLVEGGLIQEVGRSTGRLRWVARGDVMRLVDDFLAMACAEPASPTAELVPWQTAWRLYVPVEQTVKFVNLVLSGRIPLYRLPGSPEGLRQFQVVRAHVRAALQVDIPDEYMTVEAAGEALGVKGCVGYELVQLGMLKAEMRPGRQRLRLLVQRREIHSFRATYVSAVELAREHGTSSRSILRRLSRHGIVPVAGTPQRPCRQYFYNRQSVPPHVLKAQTATATRSHASPKSCSRRP